MSPRIPIAAARGRSARNQESSADAELALLAKALGHPARVAILRFLLRDGACMCGSIVDQLPLAQSTVSQHLKILKDAGLIMGTVEGPSICYCVDPQVLDRLRKLLLDLRETQERGSS